MKRLYFIFFLLFLFYNVHGRTIQLLADRPLQEQFSKGRATYRVTQPIDLSGKTIRVPDGSTIVMRGGHLRNGTLSGSFFIKGVKRGSFEVNVKKGSKILSSFPMYNYSPDINVSVMSACTSGIILKENVNVSSDVSLHCSLDGNNNVIKASSSTISVLRIKGNRTDIRIIRVTIERSYSGEINKNYAVYCEDSSNVFIEDSSIEGRLYFVNRTNSDSDLDKSSNFRIRNCELNCDLSNCPQGWDKGQDHISFYSINGVEISDCRITSTNVNRVLKTSQYFSSNDYSVISHCTDNFLFKNNIVIAKSACGKQMWDMFCGSTNVTIQSNTFKIEGFTRFVENKAYQDKYAGGSLVLSHILILDNTVNTIGSDLFQFRTSPNCDLIEIRGNSFTMGGGNSNPISGFVRSCGGYLQGYKSMVISDNSFDWKDDASGLLFLKINFTCVDTRIESNTFKDVYRINISDATHPVSGLTKVDGGDFIYSGNVKRYTASYPKSREEIYLSNVVIKNMSVVFENNEFNDSYEAIFAEGVSLDHIEYKSESVSSRSFHLKTGVAPWKSYLRK